MIDQELKDYLIGFVQEFAVKRNAFECVSRVGAGNFTPRRSRIRT
jgi:hypothetical protein